jgi:putative FmdB family regulatory protein
MPIYEYNCQDCKQIFEEWQKDYEERDIPCPVCGGTASRIISSTSFVLKGGGWYASGYSGAATSAESANTGADTSAGKSVVDATAKPAESPSAAPAATSSAATS